MENKIGILKRLAMFALAICFVVNGLFFTAQPVSAATVISETIKVGQSGQLWYEYDGTRISPKKIKFKVSNSKIISLNKKTGIVTGKKAGKTVITGTYKGKSIKWKITVKKIKTQEVKKTEISDDYNYELNGIKFTIPSDELNWTYVGEMYGHGIFKSDKGHEMMINVLDNNNSEILDEFVEEANSPDGGSLGETIKGALEAQGLTVSYASFSAEKSNSSVTKRDFATGSYYIETDQGFKERGSLYCDTIGDKMFLIQIVATGEDTLSLMGDVTLLDLHIAWSAHL